MHQRHRTKTFDLKSNSLPFFNRLKNLQCFSSLISLCRSILLEFQMPFSQFLLLCASCECVGLRLTTEELITEISQQKSGVTVCVTTCHTQVRMRGERCNISQKKTMKKGTKCPRSFSSFLSPAVVRPSFRSPSHLAVRKNSVSTLKTFVEDNINVVARKCPSFILIKENSDKNYQGK